MTRGMSKASLSTLLLLASVGCFAGCKEDKPKDTPPPPPPPAASAAKPGACASGGGELSDPVSAPFFPKTVAGYCVDPQGEVKTYGEKGKLSMDEVCTTAFDGECEVYKRFGLKRVVSLHYVDGSGKGGSVEVNLSQFADPASAYGMYTLRVVPSDPVEPSSPRVLNAGAAGATGTGRAYVWRGPYVAELQYINEQESPAELAKSSDAILSQVAKEIGDRLPGPKELPTAAKALPTEHRVPNGILFSPKDVLGYSNVGPAAMGFYKDGDKRWRVLSIVKDDVDQAKDAFKTLKSKPGTLPIAATGDEAAHIAVPISEGGGAKAAAGPKVEFLIARKGNVIWGVGDEEYVVRESKDDKGHLSKEDATAQMKALLAAPAPTAGSSSPSPAAPSSAAPASSSKK